ncbi:MAG: hypothetical protein VB011_03015 [Bacteroidales bacterium]|nr:hypothetical protein [Bacteroidales bacterium]
MSIYLVLALIGFVLIFKKLFSSFAKKIMENVPQFEEQNPNKNINQPDFSDFFERKETIKKVKTKDYIETTKPQNKINNTKITNSINEIELKEENEFDLRKAVIYSEIINNPFLSR